jgi:hypothetical protein
VLRGRDLLGALWAGFLVWVPLALGGQLLAWTAFAISGSFRPWSWVKIGLLNTLGVARVPFEMRAEPPPGLPVGAATFGVGSMVVTVALGAGTIAAVVLLFRAGRGAAGVRRPWPALVAGAAVAVGFALPMGLSSLLVTLRFPSLGIDALRPIVWQAFALPLALALIAGGIGAMSSVVPVTAAGPGGRRMAAAARGAWHTMTWGLVLALLGTLILAALRPGASTSYGRWLEGQGPGGAVLAMYHALLLPNQSIDVLATSMGSCTAFVFSEGVTSICLGGLDVGDELTALFTADAVVVDRDGTRRAPFGPGYLAFLLVPAFAAVAGGRRAAAGARGSRERILRATWAGAGFGLLAGVAAWAATISISGDAEPIASLGADPVETAALAVVWGVVGGAVGSRLPDPAGVPEEPAIRRQGLDEPSETSLK